MDRKTRRSIKKAQMAAASVSEELAATQKSLEKAKTDLEVAKASISQLEANTEVLMTAQLPTPTPEAKNAPVAF